MSLINDALKKAQNRHGETTPPGSSAAGPAAIPSAPRKGKTPIGKIALICAGIALLSAAVSATVILLVVRKDEPVPLPVSQVTPPAPVNSPPISAAANSPVPVSPSPSVPLTVEPPPQFPPTITVSPPAPVTPPEPAIKLGARVQSFIDRLRVTSIRISDTGNKAILNDRLFRLNDLVEPSLGLRLTGIENNLLTFTDEDGNTYLRHF